MGAASSRNSRGRKGDKDKGTRRNAAREVKVDTVVGTAVHPAEIHEELFRCRDIVVTRAQKESDEAREGQARSFRYYLTHGDSHGMFCTHAALVEAFLSELRAHHAEPDALSTVAQVTNASGLHLTHFDVWGQPHPHHDEAARLKIFHLLHGFA